MGLGLFFYFFQFSWLLRHHQMAVGLSRPGQSIFCLDIPAPSFMDIGGTSQRCLCLPGLSNEPVCIIELVLHESNLEEVPIFLKADLFLVWERDLPKSRMGCPNWRNIGDPTLLLKGNMKKRNGAWYGLLVKPNPMSSLTLGTPIDARSAWSCSMKHPNTEHPKNGSGNFGKIFPKPVVPRAFLLTHETDVSLPPPTPGEFRRQEWAWVARQLPARHSVRLSAKWTVTTFEEHHLFRRFEGSEHLFCRNWFRADSQLIFLFGNSLFGPFETYRFLQSGCPGTYRQISQHRRWRSEQIFKRAKHQHCCSGCVFKFPFRFCCYTIACFLLFRSSVLIPFWNCELKPGSFD